MHRMAAGLVLVTALACSSLPDPEVNPLVRIKTPQGSEIGVVTPYGIIFTGRIVREGSVTLRYRDTDRPAFETPGRVELFEKNLGIVITDVRFLSVELTYEPLEAGEEVVIAGLDDCESPWYLWGVVPEEHAGSSYVRCDDALERPGSQLAGAAVLALRDGRWYLAGQVWGEATLPSGDRLLVFADTREVASLLAEKRFYLDPAPKVYRPGINVSR